MTDLPIACSLSGTDRVARGDDIARLASRSLTSRDALPAGARLTFAADAATERELRALIAAEAECCPFLRFDLERDGDALRLDVTGPEEAKPIIAEFFA